VKVEIKESKMNILAGMITDEAGYQAVVVRPGDRTGVLSPSSDEMRNGTRAALR
jgi:hypothetical protein